MRNLFQNLKANYLCRREILNPRRDPFGKAQGDRKTSKIF